jgi:hypothetical protein
MKRIVDCRLSIVDWWKSACNRKSKIVNRKFLLLAVIFTCVLPAVTWACPTCKEALFDPGQLQQTLSTAKGYAMSIGLLLSVPAVLVGGVVALIVRSHRRQRSG